MSAANQFTLGDVVRFGNGKAIKPGGSGVYPVYGSNGIIGGSEEFRHENGVIIGRVGAYCGAVIYCPTKFWASDNTLVAYPASAQVDTKFLYYLLADANLSRYAGGAAQPLVTQTVLKQVEVRVPRLSVQRSIAGILSAYDDLIENSQRRIKILESMASALYREWFVHFRFPGHESVPLVPSPLGDIPQGWELRELANVCDQEQGIQTGPFGSQLHQSDYSVAGVPVVMPKDLIGFRIRTDSIARIPEQTANKLGRHRMLPGDIVYGRRGDIGRRAFVMSYQSGWFCGTGCLRVRPNIKAINGWYLFNYLGQDDVVGLIRGRAQGVTMPNLNTGILSSVHVRLPSRELQEEFASVTFPMATALELLYAKIDNLRHTRDLLLPRLLSGQISLDLEEVGA